MTTVYFIRHAEPNYANHSDRERELTEKGLKDRKKVTDYLDDKNIEVVLSSPYKRSIDTVKDFADKHSLVIECISDFRERRVDSVWIEDFDAFCKAQWSDFGYRLSDGETLGEVQMRNINALKVVLNKYKDKNVVIGSHGTALSTIINYFDNSFGYNEFQKIKLIMPWIVKLTFNGESLKYIEKIDVLNRL
ncbi:histidine phosphatase family protein [Clostridium sp. MCC353]|uniref:histidine phosphatase family protein n=1 Tax=Clostridium sp. MCC353 TaxID=2592646 RepID=UPI001C021810|nr:histidine phosphatase family protein [Clostridium sp. MCC353]MBT9779503.1 histidine phosphatase family protein [Clostridium sp. MCC353]